MIIASVMGVLFSASAKKDKLRIRKIGFILGVIGLSILVIDGILMLIFWRLGLFQ